MQSGERAGLRMSCGLCFVSRALVTVLVGFVTVVMNGHSSRMPMAPDQLALAQTAQNEAAHTAPQKLARDHLAQDKSLEGLFTRTALLIEFKLVVFTRVSDAGRIGLFGRNLFLVFASQIRELFFRQLLALSRLVQHFDFDNFAAGNAESQHQLFGAGLIAAFSR